MHLWVVWEWMLSTALTAGIGYTRTCTHVYWLSVSALYDVSHAHKLFAIFAAILNIYRQAHQFTLNAHFLCNNNNIAAVNYFTTPFLLFHLWLRCAAAPRDNMLLGVFIGLLIHGVVMCVVVNKSLIHTAEGMPSWDYMSHPFVAPPTPPS